MVHLDSGRRLCQDPGVAVKAGAYRGVSAEDRSAERRHRLLEAALEVWGRDGGAPVTMTRVCAEAGLTERYFYEHFSGLDEALTAVVERIAEEIATASLAAVELPGDPGERIRTGIAALVRILTDDPRKGRVAIIGSGAREALRPRRDELLLRFARLSVSEAGQLYGDRARTGPEGELWGLLFVGGVFELVRAWLGGDVAASPEELVEAATRQFTLTARD